MDPNASIGRDDDRNSAVRPRMPVRPSSVSALLSPASPPRRCDDQGDSGGRVSRLRMHDSDDDDMTLQSAISQSGELSMQMPREGAGITPYDLPYEDPDGDVEQEAKVRRTLLKCVAIDSDDVTMMCLPTDVTDTEAGRGRRPSQEDTQPITEGERGTRPSPQDKKAKFRLELASSRETDEDVFEVSGSNPLPMQAVAPQGGERREQRSTPPFGSKPGHNLELAPAREQGPENLVGRHDAVLPAATVEEQHDGANQHATLLQMHPQRIAPTALVDDEQNEFMVEDEHVAQPGAYPVDGIHARDDETKAVCHQHKTTLPYVFIDYGKMPNHSVGRFVVFLWLLCGVVAQPMKGPRKGVLVSICG